jgi:peptidoglycan glycosyltransferase
MMSKELTHVTVVVLTAFLVIGLSAAFWAVVQADSLLARDDNARNVIDEQRIHRGTIYDKDGVRLAYSEEIPPGLTRRVYPYPEAAGAVGYYSFTYGTAGIEAVYDAQLRGETWRGEWKDLLDDTLHRAQQGGDVRTTLDLDVQQAAAAALGGRRGAVIVVEVPSGHVLAMVSQPGYDPNRIDTSWERLTRDERTTPLLNRVTAGLYQPGGALQTVILAAMLSMGPDLSTAGEAVLNGVAPDARDPVQVDDLTLTCLDGVPGGPLTLADAYVYGCPAPFVNAADGVLTPEQVWERFDLLGLLDAPALPGFETAAGESPRRLSASTPPDVLAAALAGQGDLTVTPLHMAQVVAAITNRGNAVPFHLVDAVRPPGTDDWQPVRISTEQRALLRVDVAGALRLAMLQAAAQSPDVSRARRGDWVLYGHSAVAYGGPPTTPYVWFLGFVDRTHGDQTAAVVTVVVVENEDDPGVAAQVAGEAFAAVTQD